MTLILFLVVLFLAFYTWGISNRVKNLESQLAQGGVKKSPVPTPAAQTAYNQAPIAAAAAQPARMSTGSSVPQQTHSEAFDSHSFINLLPKIGIVALVIGLAFFLKYAIDEGWISITLRLVMGGVIGTLLLVLFYFWKEKYQKYALVLAGGGLAIWYLTVWAAVQLYSVLDANAGMVILVLVSLLGVFLAYKTKSTALSVMSWGSAYIIPILLGIGTDQYGLLLTYLTFLNAALLISVLYNRSLYLYFLALFGSVFNLIFTSSGAGYFGGQYLATLCFLFINLFIFSIVFVFSIRDEVRNKLDNNSEIEFGFISGVVYLLLILPIALITHSHYREFAPMIMLALGVWMFAIYALVDRLEYTKTNYVISGLGAFVVSLAIFWQFGPASEIIMIYIFGLVGLVIGRIQNRVELRAWALGVLLVGIFASFIFSYEGTAELLLNQKLGLELLGIGALLIAYHVIKREENPQFEDNLHVGIQYMIAILLWLFISWDIRHYFNSYNSANQQNLILSFWWIIEAVALLILSSVQSLKPLRKLGLLLIGLTILKVFLYDVQALDTVYRIVSFISLGAILMVISFIYQHNKEKIKEYLK